MTIPPSGQWPPGPQGPPQYWGPPAPPPKGGGKTKWVLGALGILLVVVVTVVATLFIARDDGRNTPRVSTPPLSNQADNSDIASKDDHGSAGIVIEDPTCTAWGPLNAAFVNASDGGWGQRDPAVPAERWTPEQRDQYAAVAAALRKSADRSLELARQTPHRTMRELYVQFAAYSRAYVDQVAEYMAETDLLVRVAISISTALTAICDSVSSGAAGSRGALVAQAAPPTVVAQVGSPNDSQRFLDSADPVCKDWLSMVDTFSSDTNAWRSIDPNVSAAQFNQDQLAINASVRPIMQSFATQAQMLGRKSGNGVFEDIATLSAQYWRAYASALPTYTPADNYLQVAAGSAAGAVSGACRAAGS